LTEIIYSTSQENAHFSISEALIAAIEQMKWNHVISPHTREEEDDDDSDEEIKNLQQRIRIRKREKLKEVCLFLCQSRTLKVICLFESQM